MLTENEFMDHADFCGVPRHTAQGLWAFFWYGCTPGGFVRAVLNNNLVSSILCADFANTQALIPIVTFIREYMPPNCWGTPDIVTAWIKGKGESAHARKNVD